MVPDQFKAGTNSPNGINEDGASQGKQTPDAYAPETGHSFKKGQFAYYRRHGHYYNEPYEFGLVCWQLPHYLSPSIAIAMAIPGHEKRANPYLGGICEWLCADYRSVTVHREAFVTWLVSQFDKTYEGVRTTPQVPMSAIAVSSSKRFQNLRFDSFPLNIV
jgi:hypothetical protein